MGLFQDVGTLVTLAEGAGIAAGCYLAYVAYKRGLPAAVKIVKGWWNSSKNELSSVKGDIAKASTEIAALEQKVTPLLDSLKADMTAVKAKVGL
jgi:hypothetical protein